MKGLTTMITIEDCRQLYLTEKEIDLLKTLVLPGTDFDDDGSIKSDCTDEAHVASTLYEKLRKQRRGDTGAVWVTTYELGDMYGGPEEGGWWYTHYTLLSSRGFTNIESALEDYNSTCKELASDAGQMFEEETITSITPKVTNSDNAGYHIASTRIRDFDMTLVVMMETQLGSHATVDRPFYC